MNKKENYFAYGSNMSLDRLRTRTPGAEILGVFILHGHQLKFHKIGKDGSGKCNAWNSGNQADLVEGVVFEVDGNEIGKLDAAEGLGYGYEKKWLEVTRENGEKIEVFAYFATRIDDALLPFSWYREHVLKGARRAGLSKAYISAINRVRTIPDPDPVREEIELQIYTR